jgi:hypothetical protein
LKAGNPGATCTWTSTARLDALECDRRDALDHKACPCSPSE